MQTAKLAGPLDGRRSWAWVQVEEIDGGVLTVTDGSKEFVYVVRWDGDCFVLRNTANGIRYRCRLDGLMAGCSCPAATFNRPCKHRRALAAIARDGGFA